MNIRGYVKGKPDVEWWISQIRNGLLFRKKYAKQDSWERWRKYYRGEWPGGVLPVNLYFRMMRTVVPTLYFRNPSISIQATKPGLEQQMLAQLVERIDNKLIRTMNVKKEMKKMVQNSWMFGTSAGKLGFGAEFTPTPDMFETDAPDQGTMNMKRRVEYDSGVFPNMPWFKSVHPGHLIVPDGLMEFEETPWVAMWIKRTIDDIQDDPRLKHTADLKSTFTHNIGVGEKKSQAVKSNEVDLVEIRDMRTGKVFVIAPYSNGNKTLLFDDDGFQNNNRPNIYPVVFNPDDEVFWGVPDSIILEPQQLELNEVRTLVMKHRRLSLLKILYKANSIDPQELEKLLNGDVGAAVRVVGELNDIDTMQLGEIPRDLITAAGLIEQDVRDSMGFSRNQSGDYASQKSHNAPTATEAQIVKMASDIRSDERRDILADVLVQVFEDGNELIFEKWSDEQVVQVMGQDSMPYWVAFKPAMLKAARYEMDIDPDSSVPKTKDVRKQDAAQIYSMLKDNPLIDPQMLTKYLLREFHGVQFDNMMKQLQQMASAGAAGATPDNPMNPGQFMQAQMQPRGAT